MQEYNVDIDKVKTDLADNTKLSECRINPIKRNFSYKSVLVLHDIFIILIAYTAACWIVPSSRSIPSLQSNITLLFIVTCTLIVYYRIQNLYSFHLIYSRKFQLHGQIKSAWLSILTIFLVIGLHSGARLYHNISTIVFLSVVTVSWLFISRYIWRDTLSLINVFGISLIVSGTIGILEYSSYKHYQFFIKGSNTTVIAFTVANALLMISRYILIDVIFNGIMRRKFRRQVVLVGNDFEAEKIGRHIINTNAPFWIVGLVGVTDIEIFLDVGIEKCFLGSLNNLPEVVKTNKINDIIVTDSKIDKQTLIYLLDYCTSQGVNAWFSTKLMPIINIKLDIDNFCGIPMIRLCTHKNNFFFDKIKYSFDALIALPISIIGIPFFIAVAAAIKLDSKGPVLYRANAIGKNGRSFRMLKFRSMCFNNDQEIHKQYVTKFIKGDIGTDGKQGKILKITNDPRVTRIGKILRNLSLDELPQIINVLKGEMSLVGPRPCLTYEYEIYQEWQKKRTVVRPGITGIWQVVGRSKVDFEDMILLDLYYVYNRNIIMELRIMYETIFVVLKKKGAH